MPDRSTWEKSSVKALKKLGLRERMYKVRKSAEAEQDLIEVWIVQSAGVGIQQADKYLDELEAGVAQLEANAKLGKSRDELRPGYRSLTINRHIAYYRVEKSVVSIIRVLHDRMDPDAHL